MKRLSSKLTYSNVVATLALFLVVAGGSAFAASKLGKNSVGTKQLKKSAVTLPKIAASAQTALKGATGPAGPTGPKGATGLKGDKGEKGETGPSTGPAGGDLTGNYPNPTLAASAVKTSNFASGAIAPNATKLDGLTANELARASTETIATQLGAFEESTFTNVVSKSVTAPTAGVLLIWGSLNFNVKNGSAKPAKLSVRGALDGAGATLEVNGETSADNGTQGTSVSTSGVVPITAGTHTVSLQASQRESASYIEGRTLTTLFVPFGNSGEQGILP